jgi:hypothetical protein
MLDSDKLFLLNILSPSPATEFAVTPEEFAKCVEIARKHGVEMLFINRIKKHYSGKHTFIDEYLKEIDKSYLWAVARSMRHEAVEKSLVATLKHQGIPACIIKGNEIARTLYGDPNCRNSVDIDLLVKKNDIIKADAVLQSANYIADEKSLGYFIHHTQHATYHDAQNKTLIELHWSFGIPYFFKLTSENIWQEIATSEDGNLHLSSEMLLILLLIHHHNHSFTEFKVLVDLLWAFQKYDKIIDWPTFAKKIKKLGMAGVILISISQIENLWTDDVSRIHSIQIIKQTLLKLGCKVSNKLAAYFQMDLEKNSELSIKDKILGRFALDGWGTILLSYWKTLFPPPEALRHLYHNQCRMMLPIHYMRFIFWRFKKWTGLSTVYL